MDDANLENGNNQGTENNVFVEKVDAMEAMPTVMEAPKTKGKKKYIIWAVVLLIVMIVIVVAMVLLSNHDSQEMSGRDEQDTGVKELPVIVGENSVSIEAAQNELTPEEEVKVVVEQIKTKITNDKLKISTIDDAPEYRAEGMKVFTRLDKGIGIEVITANKQDKSTDNYLMSADFVNLVVSELTSAGFEGYYNTSSGLAWGKGSYLNPQTGVVCQMAFMSIPSSLWCGHISWLSEEKKALVNELATAMAVANSNLSLDETTVIEIRKDTLEDSKYKPYQRMMASLASYHAVGRAAGLFYRTNPEAKWQFFAATQGLMNCADYDTDDLQKAYMGEGCWDTTSSAESTVKVK